MMPLACAFCAEQAASGSGTLLVMALLLVPFALAALALRVIRKLDA